MKAGVLWGMLSLATLSFGVSVIDIPTLMKISNVLATNVVSSKPVKDLLLENSPVLVREDRQRAVVNPNFLGNDANQKTTLENQYIKLEEQVEKVWGKDRVILPSPDQVVKYSSDFRSRSIIDLRDGKLIVETIDQASPDIALYHSLVKALLTPDDPKGVNLLSPLPDTVSGKPFLLGQIVDSLGKSIDSKDRASNFSAWAVVNRSQVYDSPDGYLKRVELALDPNHKQIRAARFSAIIEAAAVKYDLDVNLLYAIIETESSFNPFAVSKTGALGLMQLIARKAGRDAMKVSFGKDEPPSSDALKTPEINIELGAAYLAMLSRRYLKDIQNKQSKEYVVISAYNGGASRALRVFNVEKQKAIATVNALPTDVVYELLKNTHSSNETRHYIQKVTQAKKRYQDRV